MLIGAFFGTTFPHLFFQTYRELSPASYWNPVEGPDAPFQNQMPHGGQKRAFGEVYVPKIYGFRVSERAKSGPRMKWLRLRPQAADELDQVDWRGRWIGSDDGYEEDEEDGDNAAPMVRLLDSCSDRHALTVIFYRRTSIQMRATKMMKNRKRRRKRMGRRPLRHHRQNTDGDALVMPLVPAARAQRLQHARHQYRDALLVPVGVEPHTLQRTLCMGRAVCDLFVLQCNVV